MVYWIKHSGGYASYFPSISSARATALKMAQPGKDVKIYPSQTSKEPVEYVKFKSGKAITTRKVKIGRSYAWLDCPIKSNGELIR